ncbi:MAG: hypothetical protein U5K79_12435 [Cyclobacteriaceae bacterium]|nr:hypothetical protein [Cyclobacteriaceae bacterium]
MKTLKPINFALSLTLGFYLSAFSFQAMGQEYDDMYFTKSDRKTVKVEAKRTNSSEVSAPSYKEAVSTTESVSSKNINPEYIARYKETESDDESAYSNQDYFVEDYNKDSLNTRQIDYAALNTRDQMSQSNQNRNYSYPSWGFSPFMSMGYGMGYGMPYGYGYDPFMMGYGPSYSMGFGFGSGFYPSMSMSIGMAWGTGYNPWGGWGTYPYSPYGMYGYDPFAYGFGYPSYYGSRFSPYSGFGMYGMNSFYGNNRPIYVINGSEQNQMYKPRTNRSYADSKISRTNATQNARISSTSSRVRVPESVTNSPTDNNRVSSRDYSKTQNEYYNDARRNASSTSRITAAESTRSSYLRNSSSSQSSSTINENRPSRSTGFSNYSGQSTSGTRSTSSYSSTGSRSSSSYSTPSSRGTSSGSNNSSFSSGSSSRSSSGYSSGSTGSSSRSSSSGSGSSGSSSSSGRGGRQ